MCVFAGILYTVGGCVQSLVHPSRCQSSEPKHGEGAAGPGGDEEDEGGRHRDGQSPHQGVLGSVRPYWDYVGSSYRGTVDETLPNPFSGITSKTPGPRKPRRRIAPKDKGADLQAENVTPEREQEAGQIWVAECDGEILGCIFRESEKRADVTRICRLVTGCWYRREGLGRLLVQGLEQREREAGARRVYAHVPYPSKLGEAFFRKVGYQQFGEGADGKEDGDEEEEEERKLEPPERGFLGYPLTKVFYKDL
ncbi:putative N-acetyltransferase 14 isoform X2 [Gasterosteus aculeatus]